MPKRIRIRPLMRAIEEVVAYSKKFPAEPNDGFYISRRPDYRSVDRGHPCVYPGYIRDMATLGVLGQPRSVRNSDFYGTNEREIHIFPVNFDKAQAVHDALNVRLKKVVASGSRKAEISLDEL